MKWILGSIILILCGWVNIYAQESSECPNWISGTIENPGDYYFGVGISSKSQQDADKAAIKLFAQNIQQIITSETKVTLSETAKGIIDEIEHSSLITTAQSLKGISVSDRCHDSVFYYSLVKKRRDVFWTEQGQESISIANQKVLQAELDAKTNASIQDLDLQQQARQLENDLQKQKFEAQSKAQKLAKKRADKLAREQRQSTRMHEYGHFSRISPSRQVISINNGEILGGNVKSIVQNLSLGLVIDPFAINNLAYSASYWLLESSIRLEFIDNQLERQSVALKMQIFPATGKYYRTSGAIGAIEYVSLISETKNDQLKASYSPTLSGNIAIPHWRYTTLSFYGDARMLVLGINNYTFYDNFGDRFNLAGQINYIGDETFRNRFNEKWEFELGLQFKTIRQLTTSVTYEDHEYFKIRFEYEF